MEQIIRNKVFPHERDLYASRDVRLIDCAFDGQEDGESALKESENVSLERCRMNLRYPLWHCKNCALKDVVMTDRCRAALWYSEQIKIETCRLEGIKALRECRAVQIENAQIVSPEFGWKCSGVTVENTSLESEYAFLLSENLQLDHVSFSGKYSFQYVKNMTAENCTFDTKDAFWHAENVTVKNSLIRGEYLGWYSDRLTLIDCVITGTQPLCYCNRLKLVNCRMENADLAFEYSDVDAEIDGAILSVKNPKSGVIAAEAIGETILTKDSVWPCRCSIVQKHEK